jgi:hypothetical protein
MSRRPIQRGRLGVQRTSSKRDIDLRRSEFRWRVLRHQHLTVLASSCRAVGTCARLGPLSADAGWALGPCGGSYVYVRRCWYLARPMSPCVIRRARPRSVVHPRSFRLPFLVPRGEVAPALTVTLRPGSHASNPTSHHHVYMSLSANRSIPSERARGRQQSRTVVRCPPALPLACRERPAPPA